MMTQIDKRVHVFCITSILTLVTNGDIRIVRTQSILASSHLVVQGLSLGVR